MKKIKPYFRTRNVVVGMCVFIFILLNSMQESYTSLDQIPPTTLETNYVGVPDPDQTTPPPDDHDDPYVPPPPPQVTYDPVQPQDEKRSSIEFLPLLALIIILAALGFLLFRRKSDGFFYSQSTPPHFLQYEEKHKKLQKEILTLVDLLEEYLALGRYSEGIILGYHTLDKNMKKILGINRAKSLTPKEFATMLNLEEIVPHLEIIVTLFYIARYKGIEVEKQDFMHFINNLKEIKAKSKLKADIRVVRTKENEETI